VHTLIANIKGNIRGVQHGVSPKHLPRYLAEFCYRFNRRFWEPQMFKRMLHACLNTPSITFSELSNKLFLKKLASLQVSCYYFFIRPEDRTLLESNPKATAQT
jgi:hypothetical protein